MSFLNARIALSNGLCHVAMWFEDREHSSTCDRVQRARHVIDKSWCGLLGHPRLIYGPMRDICLDCLSIVDEHPEGRR